VKTARNIAIVALLSAAVAFTPGGRTASRVISTTLSIAFLSALAWFAMIAYRQNRVTLYSLGERNRAILYAAFGAATLTLIATSQLWGTALGVLVWFLLIGLAVYAVIYVYRAWREY
jgi:polyferredoxin